MVQESGRSEFYGKQGNYFSVFFTVVAVYAFVEAWKFTPRGQVMLIAGLVAFFIALELLYARKRRRPMFVLTPSGVDFRGAFGRRRRLGWAEVQEVVHEQRTFRTQEYLHFLLKDRSESFPLYMLEVQDRERLLGLVSERLRAEGRVLQDSSSFRPPEGQELSALAFVGLAFTSFLLLLGSFIIIGWLTRETSMGPIRFMFLNVLLMTVPPLIYAVSRGERVYDLMWWRYTCLSMRSTFVLGLMMCMGPVIGIGIFLAAFLWH